MRESRAQRAARDAGFSLVELLVVMVVIGVLAAIAIPSYLAAQRSAQDSATRSDVVNAKIALVAYTADHQGVSPASVLDGVADDGVDLKRLGWTRGGSTASLTYTRSSSTPTGWCVLGASTTGARFVVTADTRLAGGASSTACPSSY